MRNRWGILLLVALGLGGGSRIDAAEEFKVVVLQLDKKVEVQINEGSWQPATAGLKLSEGDKIHTGFKATCMLGFPDQSVVEVQPMSMIQLDKVNVAGVQTRARLLLKTGEVKAQVNRSMGARGDFQVKTPTTTASVRGTEINRISYDESAGTQIRMGGHGLLAVLTPQGRAFLAANRASGVRQMGNTPLTPEQWARIQAGVDLLPQGTTAAERADARDLGVPRAGVAADSGSAFANRIGTQPDAQTVIIPERAPPPQVVETPLIPTPLPSPPVNDGRPPGRGGTDGTINSPGRSITGGR